MQGLYRQEKSGSENPEIRMSSIFPKSQEKGRIVYTRFRKSQDNARPGQGKISIFLSFSLHGTLYFSWIRPKIRFTNSCLVKWLFLVVFSSWFDKSVVCPESLRTYIAKVFKNLFFSDFDEIFFTRFGPIGLRKCNESFFVCFLFVICPAYNAHVR